jgi:hypothetical protein
MSKGDSSDEEFLPDSVYDSDDSRKGVGFENTATNRPRTRTYISNNPELLVGLDGLDKKLTDPSSSENARTKPAVVPRRKREGGASTNYPCNAARDRVDGSTERLPSVTAYDTHDAAGTHTVSNTHSALNQGHAHENNSRHTHAHDNAIVDTHTNTSNDTTQLYTSAPVNNINTIHNNINAINTINASNMALSLGEALRLIPIFDGTVPSDIFPFLSACEIALISVPAECKPTLLKAIKTKLRGHAFAVTQYREVDEWDPLKSLLEEEFCAQRTAPYLQLELNSARQREGETVSAYSTRVQTLFHELCNVSTMGKTPEQAQTIRLHTKDQTKTIFVEGLRQPIKTLIKAGRPQTLEAAIKESIEEERSYKSDKESQRFFSDQRSGGRSKYCNHCKTNTHYTDNCRNIKGVPTVKPNKNYTQNTNIKTETASTSGWGERKKKSYCNYCKRPGHDINECRSRKKQDGQNTSGNSGNEGRPSVKSERTVRDLKLTAITSASTSSQ